jgi:hypothetical protein
VADVGTVVVGALVCGDRVGFTVGCRVLGLLV